MVAIEARTISEAWWYNLEACYLHGYTQVIDRGSFEKELTRKQTVIAGEIAFPLTDMVSVTPIGIPAVCTREYGERYFRTKILGDWTLSPNEQYTYAERITQQLDRVIEILIKTPGTNQAVIEVARPSDLLLPDPPCLRLITFKTVDHRLDMGVVFRSWDAWAGFPVNMYGLAKLQELVTGFLEGHEVGRMHYFSDGMHYYSNVEGYVETVIGRH